MSDKPHQTSMVEHLKELRNRLIKVLLVFVFTFMAVWFFADILFDFIKKPIEPYLTATAGKLIFTNPIEKFSSYIKVTFFSSLLISCPYWFYQIWQFVSPGLYRKEKKWSLLFVITSSFLFILGNLFVYFIVFPMAFRFLIHFGGSGELPYITLKDYISFFTRTSLVFGLVFQTPLILTGLIKMQVFSVERLKSLRPYVVIFVAIISAFITPPDVLSMFFVMLPLYSFFEISLWLGAKI